jgi:hypothetical protein
VADYKQKSGIPTLVADPRRTATVIGLEDINPRNSLHLQTLNGDISYQNAIAHVLLTKYPEPRRRLAAQNGSIGIHAAEGALFTAAGER